MVADKDKGHHKKNGVRPSPKEYIKMSEREKDYEIHEAIIRLRNRMHRIIYMLETGLMASLTIPTRKEVKDDDNDQKGDTDPRGPACTR